MQYIAKIYQTVAQWLKRENFLIKMPGSTLLKPLSDVLSMPLDQVMNIFFIWKHVFVNTE